MTDEVIEQKDVLAGLKDPGPWRAFGSGAAIQQPIEVIETHAAFILMGGDDVLKIKRAIKLPYLDFRTLDARRRICEREMELNASAGDDLYRGVVMIRRRDDGSIVIGGDDGRVVEWAVHMRRFPQSALLSAMCDRGELDAALAKQLADRIVAAHERAVRAEARAERVSETVASVVADIGSHDGAAIAAAAATLQSGFERQLSRSAGVRRKRAQAGFVRRCHGDLHLANIVLWRGEPVAFDALEFDERLATIDTLYDLAFLLMDLERRGRRDLANVLLNRYLWQTGDLADIEGLCALPLYLGLRAAIRAMVALDRAAVTSGDSGNLGHVLDTLAFADRCLAAPGPRLVAVGGLSGSGKTTLAARLAPEFGASPGALHLRTDLERKRLAGIGEYERLPPDAYTDRATRATYERVAARATAALAAGHSVVIDGVFSSQAERSALTTIAAQAGAPFQGLWLEAAPAEMRKRVGRRADDASDATIEVVERQLANTPRVKDWLHVDANGSAEAVFRRAQASITPMYAATERPEHAAG